MIGAAAIHSKSVGMRGLQRCTRAAMWLCMVGGLTFSHRVVADACVESLPTDLRAALIARFPHQRLPSTSDSPDDAYPASKRDPGLCLLAARADADGDGRNDYMVALPSKWQQGYVLVAALQRRNAWRIDVLLRWPASYRYMYVEVVGAGLYRHTNAFTFDAKTEKGGVEPFNAAHAGFEFGESEGTADDYFFDGRRWLYVRAID